MRKTKCCKLVMVFAAACLCANPCSTYAIEGGGVYYLRPLSTAESNRHPFPEPVRPAQRKPGEYSPAVLKILRSDPSITEFTYDNTHLVARRGPSIFARYELATGRRIASLDLSRVRMPDGRVLDISRRGQDRGMAGFCGLQFSATRLVVSNVGTGNTETVVFDLCSVDDKGQFPLRILEKGVSVVNVSDRFMTQNVNDAEGYPAALYVFDISGPEDKFLKEYKTRSGEHAVLLGDKVIFAVSKRSVLSQNE